MSDSGVRDSEMESGMGSGRAEPNGESGAVSCVGDARLYRGAPGLTQEVPRRGMDSAWVAPLLVLYGLALVVAIFLEAIR